MLPNRGQATASQAGGVALTDMELTFPSPMAAIGPFMGFDEREPEKVCREVKASHLSLISHPNEITNLILNAAGHSGCPRPGQALHC